VIAPGRWGQRVVETIHSHRELGFTVVGVLTRHPAKLATPSTGRRWWGW